jgi:hypothetical protein
VVDCQTPTPTPSCGIERRIEYMVEACNKKDYTVQEQKVIEHVQIQVHALKPAHVASPYEEKINE